MNRLQVLMVGLIVGSVFLFQCSAFATEVSPSTLNFPSAPVGSRTNSYYITLKNNNGVTMTGLSVALGGADPGDFFLHSNCGSSLSPGRICAATLYFRPKVLGNRSATVIFTDNASDAPQSVTLTGVGGAPVYLSEICDYFYWWQIGTWGLSELKLTNGQDVPLGITNFTFSGSDPSQFSFDANLTNCPSSLAPGAHCVVAFYYWPTVAEPVTDYLNVNTDAIGSPETSRLNGYGSKVAVKFPTSMHFRNQTVGTSSGVIPIRIINAQTVPLNLSAPGVTGDFSLATAPRRPCGTSVRPHLWCFQGVVFSPTATGTRTGTLTVDDDAGIPVSVSLVGTGATP